MPSVIDASTRELTGDSPIAKFKSKLPQFSESEKVARSASSINVPAGRAA